jgi:predicted protein tyrosine phosphatase
MGEHALKPLPYRLSVCGKSELDSFRGQGVTHLLSIESPATPKTTPSWFHGVHWQIQFDDVESLAEAVEFDAAAPQEEQVAEILRCGQECLAASRLTKVHLLVHCYAGASRSPAACFALAVQALGAGQAQEALRHVLKVRPEVLPNLLVVKHADRLLGQNGAMLKAVRPLRQAYSRLVDDFGARLAGD